MKNFACALLPQSDRGRSPWRGASVLVLILGAGSLVACGGNAMTGSGGAGSGNAGNASQAGSNNSGGDGNGGSTSGNGGDAPANGGEATGGASAGGGGAATPAEEERAAAACGAAIEGTNDYREGFCTFAAAFDAQDATAGAADAGAQVSPEAACEECLAGNDDSQNAALESCTEAAVECEDLTADEVENCLVAAGESLETLLPTCDEAANPDTAANVLLPLFSLAAYPECSEFLNCAAIFESLTGQ